MNILAFLISLPLAILVLWRTFTPLFGDANGFWECMEFCLTPDLISLFRGEYWEDWAGEFKLGIWFGLGIGTFLVSYFFLHSLLNLALSPLPLL